MIWLALIILAPIVGGIIIALLRRWVRTIAITSVVASLFGALMSIGSQVTVTLPGLPHLPVIVASSTQNVAWSITVAFVAGVITIYATGYFANEKRLARFFATFLGFIASMQLFIFSGDFILLLLAWELMTVTSYLLIAHEYTKPSAGRAATRAFMTTRSGDLALYLALLIIIIGTGSSQLSALGSLNGFALTIAGVLVAIAASVKAAQIPFGGWLRDAMAGPTPVSALLHSSTMVAAGALLLLKISPWLSPGALTFILLLGSFTIIIAGLIAISQNDFKRMLASSTSSQLGFMFFAIGIGAPAAAALYFTAQAFIKSSLFMGAGIFKQLRGNTSYQKLAGVGKAHKVSFFAVAIAGVALAGVTPVAGFWAKDAVASATESSPLLLAIVLSGALLTGIYIASALRKLWRGSGESTQIAGHARMTVPLLVMLVPIAGFWLLLPILQSSFGTFSSTAVSVVAGTIAAVTGLIIGWRVHFNWQWVQRIRLASERQPIQNGTYTLVAVLTAQINRMEARLENAVVAVAMSGVYIAQLVQQIELPTIQGLLDSGPRLKIASYAGLRKIQTGLVHQEIAVSIALALILGASAASIVILGGVL